MSKHICVFPFVFAVLIPAFALGEGVTPNAYIDKNNKYDRLKLASPLKKDGSPFIYNYKDTNGTWKPAEIISEVCGLDKNGFPLPCNNIQENMIDVPGGIAKLSSGKEIKYSISSPEIKINYQDIVFGKFFGNDDDIWTPKSLIRLGGLSSGRPVSMQVYGNPDGPNDSGAVFSVGATDAPFSSLRPAIGPDALSTGSSQAIANYGSLDGAVFTNQADTPVPLVRVGMDIKDWEGNTHSVTFGCDNQNNRICFSPALPGEWVSLLHRGENILTNVIGPGPYPGGNATAYVFPNVLASQINAVDPNGSYVDTLGWAVPGSGIDNGFVPMTSSYVGDNSHPAVAAGTLDTKWTQYSHPAVFFGATTSIFSNYQYCKFNHSGQHDKDKNINAADSMMHSCTALQYDIFNNDADYLNAFNGWGIAYQGPAKPSSDSQMFWLSGNVPTYNRYRYVDQGTRLFDTTAGYNVDYPLPLPVDGTVGAASARFMQGNESQINGIALKTQLWSQVDSSIPDAPSTTDYVNSTSVHIGLNWGSGPNTNTVDQNNLGQIILNSLCDNTTGSIALSGGGSPYNPNIGICVKPNGITYAPKGLNIPGGQSLAVYPIDPSQGWPFLSAPNGAEWDILKTVDGKTADLGIRNLFLGEQKEISLKPTGSGSKEYVVSTHSILQPYVSVSSANLDSSTLTLSGQGSILGWNLTSGRGASDFINVNPGGTTGGFRFYDSKTGSSAISDVALLDLSSGGGARFGVSTLSSGYGTINATMTLATIKEASSHYVSEQVWCSDCLNDGQTSGNGTGRWIFLDGSNNWRSQDGKLATN